MQPPGRKDTSQQWHNQQRLQHDACQGKERIGERNLRESQDEADRRHDRVDVEEHEAELPSHPMDGPVLRARILKHATAEIRVVR